MKSVVRIAQNIAIEAHRDQKRKYSGAPYIEHPLEVLEILQEVAGVTDNMKAAALLHDTVEDTKVTFEEIERKCGTRVAQYVADLTDISKPEDGNRAERKAIDRLHTSKISASSKSIKLADLISNSKSILKHVAEGNKEAVKFAKVYFPEKRLLLAVLGEGDQILWARAHSLVKEYEIFYANK